MGTGASFPGGKARPGRDADHSPPSSAEVKKEQELYLLSPKCASMGRNGTTLPFYVTLHKEETVACFKIAFQNLFGRAKEHQGKYRQNSGPQGG
jgi:hypothetical protein